MSCVWKWLLVGFLELSSQLSQSKQCKHRRHSAAYSVVKISVSSDVNHLGGWTPCSGSRLQSHCPWFWLHSTSLTGEVACGVVAFWTYSGGSFFSCCVVFVKMSHNCSPGDLSSTYIVCKSAEHTAPCSPLLCVWPVWNSCPNQSDPALPSQQLPAYGRAREHSTSPSIPGQLC